MKPIVLVGEAYSDSDFRCQRPFSGSTGIELFRMLNEAGIVRATSLDRELISKFYAESDPAITATLWSLHPEVYLTNVFNDKPTRNDMEYFCGPKSEGIPDIQHSSNPNTSEPSSSSTLIGLLLRLWIVIPIWLYALGILLYGLWQAVLE
jgi:hypothetical protein